MFKSIRWKITWIFVFLIVAVEMLIGTISLICTVNHFHKDFKNSVFTVFSDSLKNELTSAVATVATPQEITAENTGTSILLEQDLQKIQGILNYHSSSLSLSPSRFYAILDGKDGNVLFSSNSIAELEETDVLLNALKGEETIKSAFASPFMDYALPLKSNETIKYIIYIKDTEANQRSLVISIALITLYSILASAIAALIIGNLFAKSITAPIKELTTKAKKLADGDLNALRPVETNDEIGNLTNSLIYLAQTRQQSTDVAKGEKLKVETILQNMTDGILAFDMNGKLLHVNPEANRLLERKYLDDITFDSFFKEINANISLGDLIYMKPENPMEREIKLNNQFLHLDFVTFMLDNKVSGIIVIIHDITKQERLERSRREFVANVSHELRTPLTTIKSYSETLSDMGDTDSALQTRFLGVIASEADRMANLISDLLTLSALDDNRIYLKPAENIDIRKMLDNLVDRMSLQAKKKDQTLTYTPINDVPNIKGDYGSLERVFINIISNALKYTKDGGTIEVFSSRVYSDITIKVKDNGIGIEEEKLPHIFDRFYRVDKARSRDTGGTGLGLAIAKQSIENSFKGKIKITSEYGVGTEVIITIPVSET